MRWMGVIVAVGVMGVGVRAAGAAEAFEKIAGVAYRADAEDAYARERCTLDVYRPAGKTGYATIVWFHGGGLKEVDHKPSVALAERMTAEGVGVVVVNYRLASKAKCPAYIEDAAAAVAWTIAHIAEHGGDPAQVFVSGHSAGGYLAALVGVDQRYLGAHGVKLSAVAGCMPIAGQMITHSTVREERGVPRSRPIIDEYAPAYHAGPHAPPFLCIAGANDLPARAEENLYFTAAMKAAGHKRIACLIVEGRNHGTIVGRFGADDDAVAAALLKFMRDVSEARGEAGGAP